MNVPSTVSAEVLIGGGGGLIFVGKQHPWKFVTWRVSNSNYSRLLSPIKINPPSKFDPRNILTRKIFCVDGIKNCCRVASQGCWSGPVSCYLLVDERTFPWRILHLGSQFFVDSVEQLHLVWGEQRATCTGELSLLLRAVLTAVSLSGWPWLEASLLGSKWQHWLKCESWKAMMDSGRNLKEGIVSSSLGLIVSLVVGCAL